MIQVALTTLADSSPRGLTLFIVIAALVVVVGYVVVLLTVLRGYAKVALGILLVLGASCILGCVIIINTDMGETPAFDEPIDFVLAGLGIVGLASLLFAGGIWRAMKQQDHENTKPIGLIRRDREQ